VGCRRAIALLDKSIKIGAQDADAAANADRGQRPLVDPITHGLLIELQQVRNLSDR
jgi:hypothetical protein